MQHSHRAVLRSLGATTALLGFLSVACQPRAERPAAPSAEPPTLAQLAPCAEPAHDTAGWQLVDDYAFEFRLPPDYAEVKVQPIDSHVRYFATPDSLRSVGFDYGGWSSTLD